MAKICQWASVSKSNKQSKIAGWAGLLFVRTGKHVAAHGQKLQRNQQTNKDNRNFTGEGYECHFVRN